MTDGAYRREQQTHAPGEMPKITGSKVSNTVFSKMVKYEIYGFTSLVAGSWDLLFEL